VGIFFFIFKNRAKNGYFLEGHLRNFRLFSLRDKIFFSGFVCKRDFTEKVERLFDYENFNSKIMVFLQVGIIPFFAFLCIQNWIKKIK